MTANRKSLKIIPPSDRQTTVPKEMFDALQQGFEKFQIEAQKLSKAYEAMREDFKRLDLELANKNRQLEESLRKQEQTQIYLNSILESMLNGVIGIDTAGIITHFNKAASQITGFSQEEVLGKPYDTFFNKEKDNKYSLLNILLTGKGADRDEKVIWNKYGQPVPVYFQVSQLRDSRSGIIGAVEIFSDISRIKALEQEMLHSKTLAALGELSATVAHEIRNPLGAMGTWASILEQELPPTDSRRNILHKIIEGLSRLNRIVSSLLVYTRPLKAQFQKICLQHLLEETVNFVIIEIEHQEQKIKVEKKWSNTTENWIIADPEKIQQVIINLCHNAVQAMPHGGILTVSIEKQKEQSDKLIEFRVTDTGIGIEKENIDKIFTPFYTTKENGTGLGLAIVKKIIEHHSGYITVESEPSKGAAFRVFLPSVK